MLNRLIIGAAALALVAGAAVAQPREDRHFLSDAIRGDNSEMTLGELAAQRGASPAVRDFGRTLHDDHARAKDQAVQVAQRLGVPAPDGMMPQARQEMRRLQRLNGPAFDREFARYMVQDHRNDIAEFRHEARQRGPAAQLAERTLPDLKKHLGMAENLRRG